MLLLVVFPSRFVHPISNTYKLVNGMNFIYVSHIFLYPLPNYVESLEPDVKIVSLAIKSPGRPDILLSVPENGKPKGSWFTLKEGSSYSLQFTFQVSNNIVSGLKYTNVVWRTGVKGNLALSLYLLSSFEKELSSLSYS